MPLHNALSRLMDDARVDLPGAIDEGIRQSLFIVADEFFRASEVWQETIPVSVTANRVHYDVYPEEVSTSKLVRLIELKNSDGIPVYATMDTIGELSLRYLPNTAGVYQGKFVISVGDPVDKDGFPLFPDWILEKYRGAFLHGVLGKMMMQPAKVYSNQTLAVYHLRKFESEKSQGRRDSIHKNVRAAQAWRFPSGW